MLGTRPAALPAVIILTSMQQLVSFDAVLPAAIRPGREVPFLNQDTLIRALIKVPDNGKVIIDGSGSEPVEYNII